MPLLLSSAVASDELFPLSIVTGARCGVADSAEFGCPSFTSVHMGCV